MAAVVAWAAVGPSAVAGAPPAAAGSDDGAGLVQKLDAPLLFIKKFNYLGIHIYDTFYKWRPGGGIYVLENPSAPKAEQKVRAVIDATTPGTLGEGVYTHPELSWDAKRVLFCFKGTANGSTGIYEINIDGTGLRRLTDPTPRCKDYRGNLPGEHDISPAYLPDGRIVFTSTRHNGLVPCFNVGVAILHVMDANGSNLRTISVNNVNEFDPSVLSDGRILFGRWEYIDKGALTQQSLWTVFPDGTNETALYANNMVKPEATLDARPVPGWPNLVVSTFAPHNAPPRGTIAMIDMQVGKNDPNAIFNFEQPTNPMCDTGESCEPWPLSPNEVLYSGRPPGSKLNAILMIDRQGRRTVVYGDPSIDCHAPMLVKPRPVPPVISANIEPAKTSGRLFVQDIYQGLDGVRRGEIKQVRVIEETSRVSSTPGGEFNQVFLMSAALAWSAKNYLGVVPVNEDGSAFFEVPAGRAIYLHALDAEGRLVRSMRTFIQAAPGTTRSCIGCHEHKFSTPANAGRPSALRNEPDRLRPESWGSGFIDFPSMVQPVFDRNCVSCHGGEKGFGGGIDLSGGWTKYFTISYENLVSRRKTQVTAELISGIDCMNGTAYWGAQILPPRAHGSGAAPLAAAMVSGHKDRIASLTRTERDLVLAWIDTNGLFHGTWDYSKFGCNVRSWDETKSALASEMQSAGCGKCHGSGGPGTVFENDWFNLQRPELSRILRAPLAKSKDGQAPSAGMGMALCRDRKIDPRRQRIMLLGTGGYLHGVTPLSAFAPKPPPPPIENDGEPVVTFASTDDPHYQAMLGIIQSGRKRALSAPRVDMPGATVVAGDWRKLLPTPLPDTLPTLSATAEAGGIVRLSWERSARTLGLSAEVYRGDAPDFALEAKTLLAETRLFEQQDPNAAPGMRHYAVVLVSGDSKSSAMRASVNVPLPPPPKPPVALKATSAPGRVVLDWQEAPGAADMRYHVYRKLTGAAGEFQPLTKDPTTEIQYADSAAEDGKKYAYAVRTVTRRGTLSDPSPEATGSPLAEVKEPTFTAALAENADAALYGGGTAKGTLQGKARVEGGVLDLRQGGHVAFEHRADFDLGRRLSVELRLRMDKDGSMPVVVSHGQWNQAGWFLQRIGDGWRWHVGGIDCDGGKPVVGRWTHVVCTFDGRTAQLYQDGVKVAEKAGTPLLAPWRGPLLVGQYAGQPGEGFQTTGQIAALRIYGRVLQDKDIAASAKLAEAAAAGPALNRPTD